MVGVHGTLSSLSSLAAADPLRLLYEGLHYGAPAGRCLAGSRRRERARAGGRIRDLLYPIPCDRPKINHVCQQRYTLISRECSGCHLHVARAYKAAANASTARQIRTVPLSRASSEPRASTTPPHLRRAHFDSMEHYRGKHVSQKTQGVIFTSDWRAMEAREIASIDIWKLEPWVLDDPDFDPVRPTLEMIKYIRAKGPPPPPEPPAQEDASPASTSHDAVFSPTDPQPTPGTSAPTPAERPQTPPNAARAGGRTLSRNDEWAISEGLEHLAAVAQVQRKRKKRDSSVSVALTTGPSKRRKRAPDDDYDDRD